MLPGVIIIMCLLCGVAVYVAWKANALISCYFPVQAMATHNPTPNPRKVFRKDSMFYEIHDTCMFFM